MLITIGHTYGSGGLEIGRRLAARLEIPCGDAEADEGAVRSLAGRGSCVVVGLCADHVLSGQPGLNRIFIHCGMEQRVEHIETKVSSNAASPPHDAKACYGAQVTAVTRSQCDRSRQTPAAGFFMMRGRRSRYGRLRGRTGPISG